MPLSTGELARARDVVGGLLEELHLGAYRYEVEPREQDWEVRIECAVNDGWMSRTLAVDKEDLMRGDEDAAVRQRLLAEWATALASCVRSS